MVNGIGLGGTTTLSAGNALRMDKGLKELGIDLDDEFEELYKGNSHYKCIIKINGGIPQRGCLKYARDMDLNPNLYRSLEITGAAPTVEDASWAVRTL